MPASCCWARSTARSWSPSTICADGRQRCIRCSRRWSTLHGSQCGFCTPGFVMSLFTLYHAGQGADAAGDRRPDRRQSLPLHRLSPDRRCGRQGLHRHGARTAGPGPRTQTARKLASAGRRRGSCFMRHRPTASSHGRRSAETLARLAAEHPDATIVVGRDRCRAVDHQADARAAEDHPHRRGRRRCTRIADSRAALSPSAPLRPMRRRKPQLAAHRPRSRRSPAPPRLARRCAPPARSAATSPMARPSATCRRC